MRSHPLTVVVVYPDLLGTYGDGGNGLVLTRRAGWRGLPAVLVQADSDRPLPRGDIYCLGGGEDGPQVRAAALLVGDGTIARAAEAGAVIFGVCAGFQLLGRRFPDASGGLHDGLGLLDVTTRKGTGRRAVGELVARLDSQAPKAFGGKMLPLLTGFENHGGVTTIGPGAAPLAHVLTGVGNGAGDRTEGASSGRVVGTYLHGPVLARNPALADLLIGWAIGETGRTGESGLLSHLDDTEVEALRAQRLAATGKGRSARLAGRRLVARRRASGALAWPVGSRRSTTVVDRSR